VLENPLFDIQVTENAQVLLKKYNLKANDAILASETHLSLFKDATAGPFIYVPGGSGQNTARAAACLLPIGSVVYVGAVGADDFADKLLKENEEWSVKCVYQVVPDKPTGACVCVLSGHNRSLVTSLGAAECFKLEHLLTREVSHLVDEATFIYIPAFFLTHGSESAMHLAKTASAAGKLVATNLSAPFITQVFKVQLDELIQYADIVIGSDIECEAYATSHGLSDTSVEGVARALAATTKVNPSRPRQVLITQGASPTICASSSSDGVNDTTIKSYPVAPVPVADIVDTNGAGDCFAGGLLASLIKGMSVDDAVEEGHRLAAMCVRNIGAVLPKSCRQHCSN